ncbi:MAG TPA: hypothetical protein VMH34_06640 [Gammaproteobacteria bacterium]|nr:hypothetical protein [Gammaproteobacteria bacterium]
MIKARMKMALFALAVLIFEPVMAADSKEAYAVWGDGNLSCHNYNKARAATGPELEKIKSYVTGYLTAYNAFTPDTYDIAGGAKIDTVISSLDDYCDIKQVESLESALHHFVQEHVEKRAKISPRERPRWP